MGGLPVPHTQQKRGEMPITDPEIHRLAAFRAVIRQNPRILVLGRDFIHLFELEAPRGLGRITNVVGGCSMNQRSLSSAS